MIRRIIADFTVSSILSSFGMIKEISKNKNILVLMTTQTLFMFTAFLWWPFRSLFIKELGATNELLGSLLMIETVASIIFQYPGGILTDRWGRRKMLVISGLLRVVSPIIYYFSTHWSHIPLAILLASAGMLGLPANNALIAESLPPEKTGAGFAAYRTVTSISPIITSLLGGIIMDHYGILQGCRYVLLASIATSLFSVAMRWRYITETFTPTAPQNPKTKGKSITQRLREMPREIWILTAVGAISMFAMRVMMSFMVIYGVEVVGLSTTQWGLIGTIVSVFATVITTPMGALADRIGKKRIIIASRTVTSLSILGFTFTNNFNEMFIVRSIGSIGNGMGGAMWGPMGGPVWQALIADLSPPEERGRIMGLMGTIGSLVSTPASWLGGFLTDNVSPNVPFQVSFILDTIGTVIFILLLKTEKLPVKETITAE
ncbi:MAG: MFS transporter [Candidatus Bathyarchaeota archaeon]|nr:MFS transporter [Candidatus Bathyarchaeota archaeon]